MTELKNLPAPAKLNLFLHVTGRRADGYHMLQTAFQLIDRGDVLHIRVRGDGELRRSNDIPGVPEQQDLVIRAARLLQAEAQRRSGVLHGADITVEKVLPMGGGLGGGSSDAATTLMALNKLWNAGLDQQELMDLGLPLGADIPFFIYGRTAFAEGVGKRCSLWPRRTVGMLSSSPAWPCPRRNILLRAFDKKHCADHNSGLFQPLRKSKRFEAVWQE